MTKAQIPKGQWLMWYLFLNILRLEADRLNAPWPLPILPALSKWRNTLGCPRSAHGADYDTRGCRMHGNMGADNGEVT